MNSKTGEIPVTPPERESQRCWYSPSIFLASSKTVPRPLSRFDTHLRWPALTQSLWSGRSYGKIGDCEQSTNFISEKFSDSAVILATAVSKRCTQDLPVVNTQGSITGFLAHTWCKKAVKLTSDAQQLIQRSHCEVITIEPRKIIARKQRKVKTPRKTRIFVYLPFGHSRKFFFKDYFFTVLFDFFIFDELPFLPQF